MNQTDGLRMESIVLVGLITADAHGAAQRRGLIWQDKLLLDYDADGFALCTTGDGAGEHGHLAAGLVTAAFNRWRRKS